MKSFISHIDTQLALSTLSLPQIVFARHDDVGECDGAGTIEISDECAVVAVDNEDEHTEPSSSSSQLLREPLSTLDTNVFVETGGGTIPMRQGSRPGTQRAFSLRSMSSRSWGSMENEENQSQSHSQSSQCCDDVIVEADSQAPSSLQIACVDSSSQHRRRQRWTISALQALSQSDYENMPAPQCALVASKTSIALASQVQRATEAAKQIKALKRMNKIQAAALQKKQRKLDEVTEKSCLEIVPIGRTGKRMSVQSCFAMGLRRNMSNIAAADFGSTIMQDISHQRVCRSEVKTGAAILSRMRSRCDEALSQARQPSDEEDWSLTAVSFRCDATNSSIWKREKLHVLDADVAYVCDKQAVRNFDAAKAFIVHRCLSCPQHTGFRASGILVPVQVLVLVSCCMLLQLPAALLAYPS